MRLITQMKFGSEWQPKLVDVMRDHPWPDIAFSMADPVKVCKVCGRAPASALHVSDQPNAPGLHEFVSIGAYTDEQIASAKWEWRQRMADLPTTEALNAWDAIHTDKLTRVYGLLATCKVATDEDIEQLGCTGCAALGVSIDDIKFLRLGLAGGGVGLTCFVPPDRYCLVHEVSGGLQEGQVPRHVEGVEKVARPLTPEEIAHDKLVAAARKSEREHGAHSLLHGHTLPTGWEEAEGGAQVESVSMPGLDVRVVEADMRAACAVEPVGAQSWKCDEHKTINWACRYCVAQAIVEGDLVPALRLNGPLGSGVGVIKAEVVETTLDELSRAGNTNHAEIYARVATFTRKLARD